MSARLPMFGSRRGDPVLGSQRSMVLGRDGMVCTSQPLASFAGAEILRGGGNALDAAIAAVAVLGVVEPFSTGVGGDCFLLGWSANESRLYGLNGSGRAPAAATCEALRARGLTAMPSHGMLAVTVPGAVDAWATALGRYGSRSLRDLLAPAIHYAREGFAVSEVIAGQWAFSAGLLQDDDGRRTFTRDGRPFRVGEVARLPGLARTLELIAEGGPEAFYRGELAREIARCSHAHDGLLAAEDLAAHRSDWVEPIRTTYRGVEVVELPPNGQGIAALLGLNVLETFDLARHAPGSLEATHLRIEAVKLALADRDRHLADPDHADVPTATLLDKAYARRRAAEIRPDRAVAAPAAGAMPAGRDTVYLTAADAAGNVVSLINSLFFPFGSGITVGDTGIVLQNRGHAFSLDPAHPNVVAPGKRPAHTIIPAMLLADGRPLVSFGVMGGNVQAQAHVQVVSSLVDHGCNVQEALDQPRFHCLGGARVALETPLRTRVGGGLARLGHACEEEAAALVFGGFGGGQGIMIDHAAGVYWGGSDARKDGCAIGF